MLRPVCMLLALAGACEAQWELGAAAGYGFYRNASVYANEGKAAAGVRSRFALSVVLSEEQFERLGGELRYTYQDGDPFLQSCGVQTNLQGQSHALHYDVLVHFRGRDSRLRPYFAAGVGAKMFVVTGPPNPSAPLGGIATLTTRDDLRWLVTPGFGLKWYARRGLCVRIDFRDYITPFPKKLIAPAPLATPRGFLQQFTPMIGVSYVFPE